jgi:hypothetical protein
LVPQIGPGRVAAFAEAAGAGRLARFPALRTLKITLRALDVLSDAQAAGLAVGLASLSSLESLSFGTRELAPLNGPAAVASRLSLLLSDLKNLKELSLWGFRDLVASLRCAADPSPYTLLRRCRLPRAPLPDCCRHTLEYLNTNRTWFGRRCCS